MKRKIAALRKHGIRKVLDDSDIGIEFGYVYHGVFGEKICVTCESVIVKAFDRLMALSWDQVKAMTQKKFKMKVGKLIDTTMSTGGPMGQFNSVNITDEIAIALLRRSKGHIRSFESYPSNWQDLVAGRTTKAKRAVSK